VLKKKKTFPGAGDLGWGRKKEEPLGGKIQPQLQGKKGGALCSQEKKAGGGTCSGALTSKVTVLPGGARGRRFVYSFGERGKMEEKGLTTKRSDSGKGPPQCSIIKVPRKGDPGRGGKNKR